MTCSMCMTPITLTGGIIHFVILLLPLVAPKMVDFSFQSSELEELIVVNNMLCGSLIYTFTFQLKYNRIGEGNTLSFK